MPPAFLLFLRKIIILWQADIEAEGQTVNSVMTGKCAAGKGPYIMTGGVARNAGVVKALEEKLNESIPVPREAQLCGALGAALFALESRFAKPVLSCST